MARRLGRPTAPIGCGALTPIANGSGGDGCLVAHSLLDAPLAHPVQMTKNRIKGALLVATIRPTWRCLSGRTEGLRACAAYWLPFQILSLYRR